MIFNFLPKRWLAFFNSLLFSSAQVLLVVLYLLIADKAHLKVSEVIFTFSLGSFLFIFTGPYWALKSDLKGRAKISTLGLLGLLISFLSVASLFFYSFSESSINLGILLFSRIVYGLAASSLATVSQLWQFDHYIQNIPDENKAVIKASVFHSLSLSLGRLTSLVIAALFLSDIQAILIIYLIIMFVAFFINMMMVNNVTPNAKSDHSMGIALTKAQQPKSLRAQLKSQIKHLKWLIVIAGLFAICVEALNSALAVNLKAIWGLSSYEASYQTARLLLLASVVIVFSQLSIRRWFEGWPLTKGLLVGALGLSVGALAFALVKTPVGMSAAIILLAIGIAILPTYYMAYLKKENSGSGLQIGLIGSIHTVGYAMGSLLVALLLHIVSLNTLASYEEQSVTAARWVSWVPLLFSLLIVAGIFKLIRSERAS